MLHHITVVHQARKTPKEIAEKRDKKREEVKDEKNFPIMDFFSFSDDMDIF